MHSRDGCRQRWGRAGRVCDGYVYTLYTQTQFEDNDLFVEHTAPEIVRCRLDEAVLAAAAAGVSSLQDFPWMEPPAQDELDRAQRAIKQVGAIDVEGDITETALQLLRIPRSAIEAAVLIQADAYGCLFEALSITLAVSTMGGEARIGRDLYDEEIGLLTWDTDWKIREKALAWELHKALRLGCHAQKNQ